MTRPGRRRGPGLPRQPGVADPVTRGLPQTSSLNPTHEIRRVLIHSTPSLAMSAAQLTGPAGAGLAVRPAGGGGRGAKHANFQSAGTPVRGRHTPRAVRLDAATEPPRVKNSRQSPQHLYTGACSWAGPLPPSACCRSWHSKSRAPLFADTKHADAPGTPGTNTRWQEQRTSLFLQVFVCRDALLAGPMERRWGRAVGECAPAAAHTPPLPGSLPHTDQFLRTLDRNSSAAPGGRPSLAQLRGIRTKIDVFENKMAQPIRRGPLSGVSIGANRRLLGVPVMPVVQEEEREPSPEKPPKVTPGVERRRSLRAQVRGGGCRRGPAPSRCMDRGN